MLKKLSFLLLSLNSTLAFTAGNLQVDELTHEIVLTPGETYRGEIVVHNRGDEAIELEIVHKDYITLAGGRSDNKDFDDRPFSNGQWIDLEMPELILPPQSTRAINYSIKAPKDAENGTYWSACTFAPKINPISKDGEKMGITQRIAYLVQIISRIGEKEETTCDIVSLTAEKHDNSTVIRLDAENNGKYDAAFSSYVEIFSSEGEMIGRTTGGIGRLYPSMQLSYHFYVKEDLPPGDYSALFVLDDGEENFFGYQRKITVNKDNTIHIEKQESPQEKNS